MSMARKSIVEIPVQSRTEAQEMADQIFHFSDKIGFIDVSKRDESSFSMRATYEGDTWKLAYLGEGESEDKFFQGPVLQIYSLSNTMNWDAVHSIQESVEEFFDLAREGKSHHSPTYITEES